MLSSFTDAFASMNLTPTYLLVIGALIGYFRQQHAQSKVPGALNIPKDLLKSTDFNKLWTLLYVVLLPLSYLVNVFVYAVYALMWLIDVIGSVVRWSANKLYWLWSQLILGLGGFSFNVLWHYLVVWPYKLFAKMLSSFIASFNWEDNKASYRTVVIAVLIAVGGYLLDDLLAIELFNFSDITLVAGILYVLDAVGSHMAKAMGAKAKGMRPTYAALIVTAVLVFVAESLAQDYLLLNQAAGLLGGVVLGVSVVTWLYGVIIAAAAVQFLSLVIPAYLQNDGPFNWLTALRDSFRSRWLKSIGSILIFILAYNTLGMWIYDNVQEVAAAPYSEYTAAIDQRKTDNAAAMEEAAANLASARSADTIDANALSSAYGAIRSIHAGNAFWSAVPSALRDVVYMEVNKPFETTDEDVEGLTALVDGHKENVATTTAALDSIIALAEGELATATARRDRVNASGITASEDGAVENGTALRFGMPVPNDASSLKWRITDEEGDTIYSRTSSEIRYRFKSGDYQIFAAPVNGCGSGDWSSHSVSVNETPEAPLRMGAVRGRTDVCAGDEYTYTTAKGMDIYIWSVPTGVEILSEDEHVLKVNWGTTSGEVTVMGELDGESSTMSRLYVVATGAPGVTISDEGETPEEPQAVTTVSLEYYPVTLESANAAVDAANASLTSAQANKEAYLFEASNTLLVLEAAMQNGAKEVSGNMTSWLLNLLGKALLLIVMSLLLGIALNFMVVWTSKYFGGLYDMDQDGTTHFRATLTDYEGKYDGFPYLGLFTLIALIAVGSYFGYELALEYEMYLENDSWPTLMEYIGDKLP
ncbi:hypothetical protein OAW62_00585 [Schleiferiaceae bacterium]|nr:hypothetical protein [Schleiferiaceae bacterium]